MATADQTLLKVQRILTGPMKLQISFNGDAIAVRFNDLSTAMQLRVQDWGKDQEGESRSLVVLSSLILRDVTPSAELFEWVAREGGSRWFGHVEVHPDQAPDKVVLLMSHTLLGDFLDEKELHTAMWSVLATADTWDDELQKRFGGKRLIDE